MIEQSELYLDTIVLLFCHHCLHLDVKAPFLVCIIQQSPQLSRQFQLLNLQFGIIHHYNLLSKFRYLTLPLILE
jgi:hypothetical protein